jgi:DNA polymerase III subunit epsilon
MSQVCVTLINKGLAAWRKKNMTPQNRYVVVDVETTGLSIARGGRVIEVGAVAIESGEIIDEFATLIFVNAPIDAGAYRVHRISHAMLAGNPDPEEVWPWFLEFTGGSPLVAHNAAFDSAFIRRELALLDIRINNRWHCTVHRSRKLLPGLPNHRLDTVYQHLIGQLPPDAVRHRALDDARMAARIWLAMNAM